MWNQQPFDVFLNFDSRNIVSRFELVEVGIFLKMVVIGKHRQYVLALQKVIRVISCRFHKLHHIRILSEDTI